ncbi:MAG: PP2C family protein-serine/threonine phosphatase [Acidothermaceae bacterium]
MSASIARFWLGALIVLVGLLSPVVGAAWVTPTATVLPILAAGLLVPRRSLVVLVVVAAIMTLYDVAVMGWHDTRPGGVVVVALGAGFAYRLASTRESLGVQGLRGESMLVDLRDRLQAQGEMPALPRGWACEMLLRSTGPTSFGGDFLVAALTGDGNTLEMALVDVSGKGVDAGTRALLLSGALGGLLGAVPPDQFLPAANDYLLRQNWGEGFATAVHLVVDLGTGEYVVESAGHPPAAQFVSGSGTWRLIDSVGPLLGVIPGARFTAAKGVLGRADAMLLYTDGLVETAARELSVGIDKLMGEAERLVTQGFHGGVTRLIETVAPDANDDRALVMIWRE